MNKGAGKGKELTIPEILQVPGIVSGNLNSSFFSVAPRSYKVCFLLFY